MSTSKHTFDQVKSILGKLDRSIDDARAKRLDPARPGGLAPSGSAVPGAAAVEPLRAAPASSTGPALAAPRPLRATPNYSAGLSGRADHKGF